MIFLRLTSRNPSVNLGPELTCYIEQIITYDLLNIYPWFKVMRGIRRWLGRESTHQGMSMLAVHIITHGTRDGTLRPDDDSGHGLLIADLVGSVCDVEELKGKPKIFFINACRGGEK